MLAPSALLLSLSLCLSPGQDVLAAPAVPPEPTEATEPAFKIGGSAAFHYGSNLANPRPARNRLHLLDGRDEGGTHLDLIDLWGEWERRPIGGRLDLNFGALARMQNEEEPGRADLWEHLQQFYLGINLDQDGHTFVEIGKWVGLAGLESLEPAENLFHGQGLLFAGSSPYYHLGLRVTHELSETDAVVVGVHRGWDAVANPDHGPGMLLSWARAIGANWSGTLTYLGGEEKDARGINTWRHFADLILEHEPEGRWVHQLNLEWGRQGGIGARGESGSWYGVTGIARCELNPRQHVGLRAEMFHDGTGFVLGQAMDAYSLTLGLTQRVARGVDARLEFRQDFAGGARPFFGRDGGRRRRQDTILLGMTAAF